MQPFLQLFDVRIKSARHNKRKDKGINGGYGNVNEITGTFGGADHLRDAVNQLQMLLYAA